MARVYVGNNKIKKVLTPLLDKSRAKYRSSRSSELENSEAMKILLDINRISSNLEEVSTSISSTVEQVTGTTSIYNNYSFDFLQETFKNDGVSNRVDELMVYIDSDLKDFNDPNDQDELYLSTILRNQGRISRLMSRISTLEKVK